jgi:hypothetical protein
MTDTLPPLPLSDEHTGPWRTDLIKPVSPVTTAMLRACEAMPDNPVATTIPVGELIRFCEAFRAALPAAQPSDALLRELLEQRQEYERAGIHRSDFFFIETWARVAKRVAAPVAAQPTSGVRGPECALVCQEHKAGREACKLGACVRTAGVRVPDESKGST